MLQTCGHQCWVVAPSNTPRRVRDRIKTDRRDSLKLAGLARAGELAPIYIPDPADEAIRDLVRTREDAVAMQRQARHRLAALLLRNDIRYAGKTAWTQAHRRWIARLTLPSPAQRSALPLKNMYKRSRKRPRGYNGSPKPLHNSSCSGAGAQST